MANGKSDIRLHVGWLRHYKTEMLRANLGDGAALSLLQLWCYAAEHRPDGDLSSMSPAAIEAASYWRGQRGKLYEQLLECGWLDSNNCLHDWEVEQPWVSNRKARSAAGKLAAEERWRRERGDANLRANARILPSEQDPHADRMPSACETNAEPNAPIPFRFPSDSLPSPSPSEHTHIKNLGPQAPQAQKEEEVRTSDERLLRAMLVEATGCAVGAAQQQIATLLENFTAEQVERLIDRHAKIGMAPWDFTKVAIAAMAAEAPAQNGAPTATMPTSSAESALLARLAAEKAKSEALKAEFEAWCALPGNENKTRRDYYEERRRANG